MSQSKKWKESRRAFRRSLRNGWQVYKRSKVGLVGLGIIIMFVVMAVFAPFLTPYTPYYSAPSVDIIRDDTYSINLQNSSSWIYAPVGIMNYVTAPGANINLTAVLIYNDIGQAQIFPVGYNYTSHGNNYTSKKILKIYLKSPTNYSIPKGITSLYETGTYMASFMNANTFIANSSRNFYILDSNLKVYRNFSLPFTIQEKSIFYNNPFIMPSVGQYSLISFSHGNETILYIFYNRQLNYFGTPQPIHKIPLAKLYINTSEGVINSPLIYLNPNDVSNGYLNTSQIIIPTNNSLVSYGFNIKMDPVYEALGFNVPQVVLQPYVKWIVNYTNDHGQIYLPLSITYGYDWGDSPGI
ncbi:MAG: hypothetical protein ACP5G5_07725, partial [Thermoplasmata archaeon]